MSFSPEQGDNFNNIELSPSEQQKNAEIIMNQAEITGLRPVFTLRLSQNQVDQFLDGGNLEGISPRKGAISSCEAILGVAGGNEEARLLHEYHKIDAHIAILKGDGIDVENLSERATTLVNEKGQTGKAPVPCGRPITNFDLLEKSQLDQKSYLLLASANFIKKNGLANLIEQSTIPAGVTILLDRKNIDNIFGRDNKEGLLKGLDKEAKRIVDIYHEERQTEEYGKPGTFCQRGIVRTLGVKGEKSHFLLESPCKGSHSRTQAAREKKYIKHDTNPSLYTVLMMSEQKVIELFGSIENLCTKKE